MANYSEGSVYRGREGTGGAQIFKPTDLGAMGRMKGEAYKAKEKAKQKAKAKYKPDAIELDVMDNNLPHAAELAGDFTMAVAQEMAELHSTVQHRPLTSSENLNRTSLQIGYNNALGSFNNANTIRLEAKNNIIKQGDFASMSGTNDEVAYFERSAEVLDMLFAPFSGRTHQEMADEYGDDFANMLEEEYGADIYSNDPVKKTAAVTKYTDKYLIKEATIMNNASPDDIKKLDAHWMKVLNNKAVKMGGEWKETDRFNANLDAFVRDTETYVSSTALNEVIDDQWNSLSLINKYKLFDNDKNIFTKKMEALTQEYEVIEDMRINRAHGGGGGWGSTDEIPDGVESTATTTNVSVESGSRLNWGGYSTLPLVMINEDGSTDNISHKFSFEATGSLSDLNLVQNPAMRVVNAEGHKVNSGYMELANLNSVGIVMFNSIDEMTPKLGSVFGNYSMEELNAGISLSLKEIGRLVNEGLLDMTDFAITAAGNGKYVNKSRYLQAENDGDYQIQRTEMHDIVSYPSGVLKYYGADGIEEQFKGVWGRDINAGGAESSLKKIHSIELQKQNLKENGFSQEQINTYINHHQANGLFSDGSQDNSQNTKNSENTNNWDDYED